MGKITDKLRRIYELYNTWCINQIHLNSLPSEGQSASIRRNQVFLKEKILASMKDIQDEIQTKVFVVYLINHRQEYKTILVRADSYQDIMLYVELLGIIKEEYDGYHISSVDELPTMYNGYVNFETFKHK